ncbi:peptidylprolyl isomerase [Sphingomonas rubra]|uniref:peptidylprolyl isomerase n=1 Tax=Sphingomonas rubra TaxID=634430 RepID=A0A1I5U342_9SPHN|nr:peptidylprolyl isomerase [Sphingomonas rubra]SFP89694.1 peptidyl-prolyl cis-trans isomerase A (cyclophilin A) [Sphingomonas rubra]
MTKKSGVALALVALALPTAAPTQTGPRPGIVRVRLDTEGGPILLALDARRAPATTANFLKYVDDGRFDNITFYRAARSKADPKRGFIQAGIRQDAKRILPSFPFESTSKTGIRHLDATISMARGDDPASAGGNWVLTVGPTPQMDARGDYKGYAAFGRVVGGMDLVKRILALPSGGGFDAMKGQMILRPIVIRRAVRLDGTPKPTGLPKVWLMMQGRG